MRLAAILVAAILAASSDNERAMRMLNDWIAAVDQHVPGEDDEALDRVESWSLDDLGMMRGYVEALSGLRNDNPGRAARRRTISGGDLAAIQVRARELRTRGNFDRFLKRAAILHTDIALLAPFILLSDPPPPRDR